MPAIARSTVIVLLLLLWSWFAKAQDGSSDVSLPIQSKAALQRYLATTPTDQSPLSRLSPMGRRRFLDDLRFTERGVGGYGVADLMAELTATDIREVLALFGLPASEALLRDARDVNLNDMPSRWPIPKEPTEIGEKFDVLRAIEHRPDNPDTGLTDAARSRALRAGYDRLFGPTVPSLDATSDRDLHLLFRASSLVIAGTRDPKYFDEMDRRLAALQSRRLASKDDYRVMHGALVLVRDFERADALARTHPDMELTLMPALIDTVPTGHVGPTEWAVDSGQYRLIRKAVDLDGPTQVIVVAQPGCRYSSEAMESIDADPVLGPLFAEHARWLAPQDGNLDVAQLQLWNKEHDNIEVTLTVDAREWPMIDEWATPIFYFFEDGELVKKVSGWPLDGAGRRSEVARGLAEIGLIDRRFPDL